MSQIIPAIIPKSLSHLCETLEQWPFAPAVQIDVVDGLFVPSVSWPYSPAGLVAEAAPALKPFSVMVDLMVTDQLAAAEAWLAVGAETIVVHLEGVTTLEPFTALKKRYDYKLFLAADDETPMSAYVPFAPWVDGWQVMGIDAIGKQGQPFSPRSLETIVMLKAAYPSIPIVVDGSVNQSTIVSLKDAGADDFVVGSAIVGQPDPHQAYVDLVSCVRAV